MCLYTLQAPFSTGLWLVDMYSVMEDVLVVTTQLIHDTQYITNSLQPVNYDNDEDNHNTLKSWQDELIKNNDLM